jgi:hypothetical protein
MEFDLRELARSKSFRISRGSRAIGFVGAVLSLGGAGVLSASLILEFHAYGGQWVAFATAIGLLAFCGVMFAWVARIVGPSPRNVAVDSRGFAYSFANGRIWRVAWDSPTLVLRVYQYDPTLGGSAGEPVIAWVASPGHSPVKTMLTNAAAVAIIASARTSGLNVEVSQTPTVGIWRSSISHR